MREMVQDLKCSISFYVNRILKSILLCATKNYSKRKRDKSIILLQEKYNKKWRNIIKKHFPNTVKGTYRTNYKMDMPEQR